MSSVERHLHFEDALYLLKGGGKDCSYRLEREGDVHLPRSGR